MAAQSRSSAAVSRLAFLGLLAGALLVAAMLAACAEAPPAGPPSYYAPYDYSVWPGYYGAYAYDPFWGPVGPWIVVPAPRERAEEMRERERGGPARMPPPVRPPPRRGH